jgi:hypothetical protein
MTKYFQRADSNAYKWDNINWMMTNKAHLGGGGLKCQSDKILDWI